MCNNFTFSKGPRSYQFGVHRDLVSIFIKENYNSCFLNGSKHNRESMKQRRKRTNYKEDLDSFLQTWQQYTIPDDELVDIALRESFNIDFSFGNELLTWTLLQPKTRREANKQKQTLPTNPIKYHSFFHKFDQKKRAMQEIHCIQQFGSFIANCSLHSSWQLLLSMLCIFDCLLLRLLWLLWLWFRLWLWLQFLFYWVTLLIVTRNITSLRGR